MSYVMASGSSVICHSVLEGCQMFVLGSGVIYHSVREWCHSVGRGVRCLFWGAVSLCMGAVSDVIVSGSSVICYGVWEGCQMS